MPTVDDAYRRMLASVATASVSIQFEFYIFRVGDAGDRFRTAFAEAARRGVKVRVLLDAFGCGDLPSDYWEELLAAGGEVFRFNPGPMLRLPVRNHQKLLVVDETIAFLGGFNIGPEYEGDGVGAGWRDLGLVITGPAVAALAVSFEAMWRHRDFRYYHGLRAIAARWRRRARAKGEWEVMSMGPGLGRNTFHDILLRSVRHAREVLIISAYFVPGLKLRRALRCVARRGGRVRLILAGRTDVAMVQAAGRTYYSRLLHAGVEIAEYQPQILHTKFAIIDGAVFAGSSNLDARSLTLNYELMVRVPDPALAAAGRALFEADWAHSRLISLQEWKASRTWTEKIYGLIARFCLTKIDPWFAHRRLRSLS